MSYAVKYNAAAGGNSISVCLLKCFLLEVESRTQGSRPRTQKKSEPKPVTDFPRTDLLEAKDRNAEGKGHNAQVFSKKKKRSRAQSRKFFVKFQSRKKMVMTLAHFQKIVLSSAEDRVFSGTWRLRGQGLDLGGQGRP